MDFDGEFGLWQRKIADCLEGQTRRLAVIEALELRSGQAIIDLGCGGGHLVHDIAQAVGESGRAVGLDASAEQLQAAASRCAGLAAAEFVESSATELKFADASFDALASIQMLEYIDDANAVLVEARRVLKAGGRIAMVSVLWDHWKFHGPETGLNNRMHEVWRDHCPHQMLPFEMSSRLLQAGFSGVAQKPLAFINNRLHANSFALWASKLFAAFAVGQAVPEEDAALWLEQLSEADDQGRFGFVSVPVMTTAIAS